MKLDIKTYKIKKIENHIKNNKIIFIMSTINSKIEKKKDLKNFFVTNNFFKKVLRNSIYSNLVFLVQGLTNLSVIKSNTNTVNIQKKLNSQSDNLLIALKLNDKVYSPIQLTKIKSLNYKQNIIGLHKTLKNYLSFPGRKFISK